MLAIAHWTGQIPRRPPIPEGCSVNQLIALGSRRKRSKVYWMIAQSEKEVRYGIKVLIHSLYSFSFLSLFFRKVCYSKFFRFLSFFCFLRRKTKKNIKNSNNNFCFPRFFCSRENFSSFFTICWCCAFLIIQ